MKAFSLIRSWFSKRRGREKRSTVVRRQARLAVEALETRQLLSSNSISGYVFSDANNNGLYDSGESPIANATVELENAQGAVIGTTTTNSAGYYVFTEDDTVSTAPTTKTLTLSFNGSSTNWTQTQLLSQFDPSLGTLTSVDIINQGTLSNDFQFENLDNEANTISGSVTGNLQLTGPWSSSLNTNVSQSSSFNAAGFNGTFNGTLDFNGPNGYDSGWITASNSQTITLTSPTDLASFEGTGTVSLSENASASSTVNGPGNEVALINTNASAQVTVVYHYIPNNSLQPGNYTVILPNTPTGYVNGLKSSNGVVLPNSDGTNYIPVTLSSGNSSNNDFGELATAQASGFVYMDSNDNGIKDPGEAGISGVTVTLTGTNDLGAITPVVVQTQSDGSYDFGNLRPGTYMITVTPPNGYLNGQITQGNVVPLPNSNGAPPVISNLVLNPGATSTNNNFGELLSGSLSGYVYADANKDGVRDSGDTGISNVAITLTGTNDLGQTVNLQQTTNANGQYTFSGLRPGTYTISEGAVPGYDQGTDNVGTLGGSTSNDQFFIALPVGGIGLNYNFGELLPGTSGGKNPPPNDPPPPPTEPPLSKILFLASTFREWW